MWPLLCLFTGVSEWVLLSHLSPGVVSLFEFLPLLFLLLPSHLVWFLYILVIPPSLFVGSFTLSFVVLVSVPVDSCKSVVWSLFVFCLYAQVCLSLWFSFFLYSLICALIVFNYHYH